MIREYIIKVNDDVRDATGGLPLLEKPQELVRCKDCKKATDHSYEFSKQPYHCRWRGGFNDGDWFCAGGVRKDGD